MRHGKTQTRKRQTLASVMGAMFLCATGSNAFAQQPSPPDASYYAQPSYPGYVASPASFSSGESWIGNSHASQAIQQASFQPTVQPPPELMAPGPGMPPGMGPGMGPHYSQNPDVLTPPVAAGGNFHPYPGVEQYQYAQQQTSYKKGLWFNEKLNASRTYKGKAEYMYFIHDNMPDTLFGYDGGKGGVGPDYNSMPRIQDEVEVSDGDLPVALDNDFGFRPRNVSSLVGGNERAPGLRVEWGWENEDGTGVMLNGWWGSQTVGSFTAGTEPFSTFDDANVIEQFLFPYTLTALNPGISVNDGTGQAFIIPFDQYFDFKSYQQVYGAGFLASSTPWYKGDWYSLKPVWGLRYINLKQGFNFNGFDSGASYTYQNRSGADQAAFQDLYSFIVRFRNRVIDDGTPDEVPPGTPLDGEIITDPTDPDGTFVSDDGDIFVPTSAYQASMSAQTDAFMAGPELGLQLDLGSDNFGLMLKVTGGVAVTYEQTKLDGFGFYNHFISTSGQLISDSDLLDINSQSGFEDTDNSTHASPFMDASVNLHAKIFSEMPYIEDTMLQDANLVLSAGYMVIGNVTSPYQSVNYTTWPINPSIDIERRMWELKYLTAGLEFTY
jgi:hypothetical protein